MLQNETKAGNLTARLSEVRTRLKLQGKELTMLHMVRDTGETWYGILVGGALVGKPGRFKGEYSTVPALPQVPIDPEPESPTRTTTASQVPRRPVTPSQEPTSKAASHQGDPGAPQQGMLPMRYR